MINYRGNSIIDQFPGATQTRDGRRIVYLDSAASAFKPKVVVDRISKYYLLESANVHRGAHYLSDQGTANFEGAREKIKSFLGADEIEEIVFTKGTTESINLVAHCLSEERVKEGDEILLSEMEHHSNIVPWQVLAQKVGAQLKYIPTTNLGEIDLDDVAKLISKKTKVVAVTHCSNVLGTVNPVKEICELAQKVGAITLIDGAQAVSAIPVDVVDINCDFYTFSGHKLFGPYGVGVLYGKKEILNSFLPYQTGGSMIQTVDLNKSTYLKSPQRFEAGTPNIAGAIGLGEAISFVEELGLQNIQEHERQLLKYARNSLSEIENLRFFGQSNSSINVLSFAIEGAHHSDVGVLLDKQGVAVRTGHHCCQPLMKALGVKGTVRASFSIYNSEEDIDCLQVSLKKATRML